MVKRDLPAGLPRILSPVALCLLLNLPCLALPQPALAATWQWSSQPGRERVELRLDAGMREQATIRTSPTSLDIQLSAPANVTPQGTPPASGSLVTRLEPDGNTLRLTLRDPAFGYIVQRGSNSVTVEVFPDQLGTRWQPSDTRVLPPTPVAPSATPPTSPANPVPAATGQAVAPASASGSPVQPAAPVPSSPSHTAPATPGSQPGVPSANNAVRGAPSSRAVQPQSLPPTIPEAAPTQPVQTAGPTQPSASAQGAVQGAAATVPPAVVQAPGQVQVQVQGPAQSLPQRQAAGQPAGQASVPAPQTPSQGGGTTVRINVSPAQTPAAPATAAVSGTAAAPAPSNTVTVNTTPAGMPGAGGAASGPIAVASGTPLPVQEDPPAAHLPSAAALGALTRKIESLPVQEPSAASTQAASPLNEALLSTPAAPPAAAAQPTPQSSTQVTVSSQTSGQLTPNAPAQPRSSGPASVAGSRVAVAVSAAEASTTPLVQAEPASAAPSSRLVREEGDSLRARYNTGGPEVWPESDTVSSSVPAAPAAAGKVTGTMQPSQPAAQPPAGAEEKKGAHAAEAKPEPEVLYVDEKGNPVPKPLDTNAMMAEARTLIQSLQFEPARDILMQLKAAPMPPEKREEMLYLLSDAVTGLYNGKWLEGYEPIVAATSEAMNANLRSPQVARALERLGMINLRTGNQQDAAGYFGVLRSKFPRDPQVPECYYALGADQLKNGQYAEAVQSFQLVMQEYPESQEVRPAARYMAEALYKQGHYERAMTIIDFVDRRWPRIYIDDPSYLLMVADAQFRRGRLDEALQTYWIYYNLVPSGPTNDQLLLNVGTIYMMQGDMDSARAMYAELLRRYPDSQYAPLAVLRQGEEGIFEGNLSLDDMFAMFNRPNLTTLPEVAYSRLTKEYPKSEEAVTATLRQAAWKLWNKDYAEAMDLADAFIKAHPDSMYAPRADEIILRAFAVELAMDLTEENYERILQRWERFPQIRGAYTPLNDNMRVALARAHLNRGNEKEGFALLSPFLDRPQDPNGDYTYELNLAKAFRTDDWQGILDLGAKVENWKLPEDKRNELVYAMATARENLGQGQEAVPLWAKLYKRDDIPLYQKAYANYFMARDAERRRSIEDAYELNKTTLELFTRLGVENPERAAPERIRESLIALMDVTEVANRFAEALDWAEQYAPFVPDSSPDYVAHLFRLARLNRKMGDLAKWQYMLEDIIKREPDSVFGRMAASELRTHAVARDLSRFQPSGSSSSATAP